MRRAVRRLEIFGRPFVAERGAAGWRVFDPGAEGKRGPELAVPIPAFVRDEGELVAYLADACHEWATPERPTVRWLE